MFTQPQHADDETVVQKTRKEHIMRQRTVSLPQDRNARYGVSPRFSLDYHSFCTLHLISASPPAPRQYISRFASHLASYLPEVAARIDDLDFGVLHLEVGVLARTTQEAIETGEWRTVIRHFNFVDDLYRKCGAELRHAFDVSYLGNLLYGELSNDFAKARVLLPKGLTVALEKVERHYDDLVH